MEIAVEHRLEAETRLREIHDDLERRLELPQRLLGLLGKREALRAREIPALVVVEADDVRRDDEEEHARGLHGHVEAMPAREKLDFGDLAAI